MSVHTFEQFETYLRNELQIRSVRRNDPGADLVDDWGLDSLQVMMTLMIVEELAEHPLGEPALSVRTIGDVYSVYLAAADSR